jgi:hypothetical protein
MEFVIYQAVMEVEMKQAPGEAPSYKHICGYPLMKNNELTHCPGCGGRITPWNTHPVDAASETLKVEQATLHTLVDWLASNHPGIAIELVEALEADLQGNVSERPLLRYLLTSLSKNLKET